MLTFLVLESHKFLCWCLQPQMRQKNTKYNRKHISMWVGRNFNPRPLVNCTSPTFCCSLCCCALVLKIWESFTWEQKTDGFLCLVQAFLVKQCCHWTNLIDFYVYIKSQVCEQSCRHILLKPYKGQFVLTIDFQSMFYYQL